MKLVKLTLESLFKNNTPPFTYGVGIVLALLVYKGIFLIPIPAQLGFALRYTDFLILLPILGLTYLVMRLENSWAWSMGLIMVVAVFGLTLASFWSTNISNLGFFVSLLPRSDAYGYWSQAQALLSGTPLSLGFTRPFWPGLLAIVLSLTQNNLQGAIALITLLVAISIFIAAWEIRQTHGALAGTLLVGGLFFFLPPLFMFPDD